MVPVGEDTQEAQ
jgi:hypothetical protein